MIAVDTNIICYFYLNSRFSQLAEDVYMKEPEWAAPALWKSELRNVLSMYIKKNIITLNDGVKIFEKAESLMGSNEFKVNSNQILSLAQKSGCSAYDCEFICLAQDLDIFLITMDNQILTAFPEKALSMIDFLEKPGGIFQDYS